MVDFVLKLQYIFVRGTPPPAPDAFGLNSPNHLSTGFRVSLVSVSESDSHKSLSGKKRSFRSGQIYRKGVKWSQTVL